MNKKAISYRIGGKKSMNNNLYIDEVKCPKCGSYNTYIYDNDEIQFNYDGTGHVNYDHHCKDCDKNFRVYTKFTFVITKQETSK